MPCLLQGTVWNISVLRDSGPQAEADMLVLPTPAWQSGGLSAERRWYARRGQDCGAKSRVFEAMIAGRHAGDLSL